MNYNFKLAQPGRIIILAGLFLYLTGLGMVFGQVSTGLSREELDKDLRKALIQNNDLKSAELIEGNRLLIKPFVDGLVREAIILDLKRKDRESAEIRRICEKTATYFEEIFGEKSLKFGVNYLTIWSIEQKRKKLTADSLYAAGTGYRIDNQNEKALEFLWNALNNYNEIGDERGEAEVLGGLGALYYNNLKSYAEGLEYYQKALVMREKVDDRQLTGNTLNSLGAMYISYLKDYPGAIKFLDRAEEVRSETGEYAGLKSVRFNKGYSYKLYGDQLDVEGKYNESIDALNKAYEIFRSIGDKSDEGEVVSIMGFVYTKLGDYGTASEKLTEAISTMKEVNDTIGLAGVYNHFGILLQRVGRTEKAAEYYNSALEIYEKSGETEDIIPVIGNLGTLFFDNKDYKKAEMYHIRGLKLCEEVNDQENEIDFLLNLANDKLSLGKTDEALSIYQEGLDKARKIDNPDIIWRITVGLAETYEKKGDLQKVIELNDSGLRMIDSLRNNLLDEELRTTLMARERYIFEDIIDFLAALHMKDSSKGYDELAFNYAEQSKSRALLDLLSGSAGGDTLNNSNTASRPVTLSEFKASCTRKNVVFLEYFVGDSSSCLWVIKDNQHKLFRIPESKTLREQVETIRFGLLDPYHQIGNMSGMAATLYEELIKPAEPFLTVRSLLVIIPDGVLNYLPYEVLLTSTNQNFSSTGKAELPYLIRKFPVSYSQSASVLNTIILRNKNNKGRSEEPRLLAIGDPDYEKLEPPMNTKYQKLVYSSDELENIASDFRRGAAELYLREDATEDALKGNNELDRYNFIHFATHGTVDEDDPDKSSLVLTSAEGSKEDGFLTAAEIKKLKLNADLVVLSACQTGLGRLVRGEGIIGLTRAFMYSGSRSVLVTLWSVEDESTSVLMGEFYKNLIRNKSEKTDALRKAQISLINSQDYSHPFYWAPFVLIGDWQ